MVGQRSRRRLGGGQKEGLAEISWLVQLNCDFWLQSFVQEPVGGPDSGLGTEGLGYVQLTRGTLPQDSPASSVGKGVVG